MTDKEYQEKKRECWEEFNDIVRFQTHPSDPMNTFFQIFDRAYALGRQTETVTQEEIENEAVDYAFAENKKRPDARRDTAPEYMSEDLIDAFKAGANFALGKQEKDADTVIQGWVARDEDGRIYLYEDEPKRENGKPYGKPSEWVSENIMTKLSVASFPDLTWESDPIEVEIIIKERRNESRN